MEYTVINKDIEGKYQDVLVERIQYGIWDHQLQKLTPRYVRPVDADYKRVETRFPRLFNQLNHATTALNQILSTDQDAFTRYDVVTVSVSYNMTIPKPSQVRTHSLVKKRALSKLSVTERAALGV